MRHSKKKYKTPQQMWNKTRIENDKEVVKKFGLKKKREIWIAESLMRKYRRFARVLAASRDKENEAILIEKLVRFGILKRGATLDDILGLDMEHFLNRRLQTVVFSKGLSTTIKQARQFIVHGHITVNGKRVVYPSYMVPVDEEEKIQKSGAKPAGEKA